MRCASRGRSRSPLIGLVAIVMVAGSVIQKGGATTRQIELTAQTSGVTCHTEQVPMRDGTLLATDVYLPAAPGRYPVIVRRTPYGLRLGQGCFEGSSAGMAFWAENGYVAVSQDVRRTFRSGGTFRPIFQEQADGYDAIEWAAAQAWSNGKVGMTGSSYMGATQWQAAVTAPPHLVAIAPGQTATDYHDHWTYVNGVFDLWFAQSWLLAFFAPDEYRRQQIEEGVPPADALTASDEYLARGERQIFTTWARQIPLTSFSEYRTLAPYYYEWLAHPNYDDYWATVDIEAQWEKDPRPRAGQWRLGRPVRDWVGAEFHGDAGAGRIGDCPQRHDARHDRRGRLRPRRHAELRSRGQHERAGTAAQVLQPPPERRGQRYRPRTARADVRAGPAGQGDGGERFLGDGRDVPAGGHGDGEI